MGEEGRDLMGWEGLSRALDATVRASPSLLSAHAALHLRVP